MNILKKNDPAKAKDFFAAKLDFTTGPVELDRDLREGEGIVVVDVREAEDYREGHIPGAINLPREKWSTLQGLRKDALNVLYCYTQQCHLAANAAFQFSSQGFPVMELEGGFETWKDHDLEIETEMPEGTRARQVPVSV
jgi:rhodanese-related sulfurtransferase